MHDVRARVRLRPGRERRVAGGHLWVYDNEIDRVEGNPAPGDLADVLTDRGHFLGRGTINPRSKIRVRLFTRAEERVDEAFFARRLGAAAALRARVVRGTTAYRLVFGEGDLLPGLIVDVYGDALVAQALTAGIDRRLPMLVELLVRLRGARAVYLRNDAKSRALEGLPLDQGFAHGDGPTEVEIQEGPARFVVDVARGQKTGWFCDQRENRLAVAPLAQDAHLIDAFCHTGAFGVHAALAGAASVLGIDASADALARARRHAAHNGVEDRCTFREADAFDELRRLAAAGHPADMVILDPPAFARSRAAVPRALAGYKEINLQALRLLRPGGLLVTCSCSWHVDEGSFWSAVTEAAADARRQLRLIEFRSQARDHPMLAAMPETRYLKCLILQVIG
ncbi:MAG: class I SAM-dependent rRNA methyltransferase [Armatimonadota bacterium]|nr:class I SAM-dependent rRNA methyltransferase [Armatimonadota bacterium]MDR7453612.1 class I SAM-dependent rRNA methyltransferase [Armatimonadota bacterium]MDR7456836.1 class I SAM-dependent rRNA methyltransferase [Armatimonadota bacterium]MDR7495503.1 class I SAM-dependent rRNA methyltransferase [Armatimonadota bacterium]MDR7510406.1 class I SAM-dependent rRNA methyltransferase [Armatimonadota bacterium]